MKRDCGLGTVTELRGADMVGHCCHDFTELHRGITALHEELLKSLIN